MRILGLIIIAFAVLFEMLGVMCLVIAMQDPGVGWIVATGVFWVLGTSLLIIGIRVLRRGKPIISGSVTEKSGTRIGKYVALVPKNLELDGAFYTVLYTPPTKGKNKQPSKLRISTKVDVDGEFEIVPESGLDRFGKRWGLAAEIQTLDETFDDHCFVRTDTVALAEAYLTNPDNRAIIADLHRKSFKSVALQKGEIHTTWVGFDPLVNDSPDLAEEIGARLILLSRKLPPDLPEVDLVPGRRRKQLTIFSWVVLVAYAGTIVSLIGHVPVHESDLLVRALPVFLLGFPLFLFVAGLLVRGTSRSHYSWRGLLIGGFLLFPVGSIGTISGLNTVLDQSDEEVHDMRIIRKYTTKSKNSTSYHVECESWRDPVGTESFKISSSEYTGVQEGQSRLLVATHSGGLGFEWVKNHRIARPPVLKR